MKEKELIEKNKEYLNEYKELCRKQTVYEEQLKNFYETINTTRGIIITDVPKGQQKSDLSDYIVKLEELENKILSMKESCCIRKLHIQESIGEMEEGIESLILYLRYIKFMTWDAICEEIGYSNRQTHRLHLCGLRNFIIMS